MFAEIKLNYSTRFRFHKENLKYSDRPSELETLTHGRFFLITPMYKTVYPYRRKIGKNSCIEHDLCYNKYFA